MNEDGVHDRQNGEKKNKDYGNAEQRSQRQKERIKVLPKRVFAQGACFAISELRILHWLEMIGHPFMHTLRDFHV